MSTRAVSPAARSLTQLAATPWPVPRRHCRHVPLPISGSPLRRGLASATASASDTARTLVYESPYLKALRKLKAVSLTTCALAAASGPAMLLLNGGAAGSRGVAAAIVVATGLGSTGLLTAFLKPYVVRMYMDNVPSLDVFLEQLQSGTDPQRVLAETKITFETLDILGRARTTSLPMAELTRSDAVRPFTTWRTVPSKETRPQYFFVHEDLFRSRNEQLLVKLLHSAKEG